MAFELPSHLPRGGLPQDKPTQILTKIGQATHTTLTANLAASWLHELDSSIQDTKNRISQTLQNESLAFERQLKSSASIQTRLSELCNTGDALTDTLNNPKTGILPTLLQTLTVHATLSSQAKDSEVIHRVTAHLLCIRNGLYKLSAQLEQGQLLEAAEACVHLQGLIADAPNPLDRADIMGVVRKQSRALSDRLQEQLNDAYARSVRFSSSDNAITLTILTSTRVLPTPTLISLSAILQSLAPDSLSAHLSSFRRDLITKFLEASLLSLRPITLTESDPSSLSLSLSSTSPSPFQSLQTLMSFLDSHFFPHLPSAQASFPTTLHAPITSAILTHLLEPSVPSSLPALPSFLGVIDEAVHFEDRLLSGESRDRPIRHWVADVAGHYEKKRRESFLRLTREELSRSEDGSTFRIKDAFKQPPKHVNDSTTEEANTDAWGFDEEVVQKPHSISSPDTAQDQDGHHLSTPEVQHHRESPRDEEDASDGWGWGDDANDEADGTGLQDELPSEVQESDVDPWDDDGWSNPMPPSQEPELTRESALPAAPKAVQKGTPKLATRLEKFSAKAKGHGVTDASTSVSPVVSQVAHSPPPSPSPPKIAPSRPPQIKPQESPTEQEWYLVSSRAKKVLEIVENAMQEGQELSNSNVFAKYASSKTTESGKLLAAAAPSILDLYRALYPIAHSSLLARDSNLVMRWSNDCKFVSTEVTRLRHRHGPASLEERWSETVDRLDTLGDSCYETAVGRQQEATRNILVGARRFLEVSSNDRFEECKTAVARVLKEITFAAYQWKETLTRSTYVHAVGQVVDDALFRVMDDILSLEDIPEADSERLSELCELLAPLEELFVYGSGESMVGRYVPLWFKFSYLSWLLKGSIADLSYLFDQGMLVDYEIGELVRLLRALFSETPLRESTMAKITQGHPLSVDDEHHQ